jgi:integrase/recombinase XerC
MDGIEARLGRPDHTSCDRTEFPERRQRLLAVCQGTGFAQVRDQALVRMYCSTGARLAEIGGLLVVDVDMDTESVWLHGKGAKDRQVRFGPKTARVLSRYLRLRGRREGAAEIPQLWLSLRGPEPLQPAGIKVRLKRLGELAGVEHVHAHRWRHSFAHEWKLQGGNEGDLMLLSFSCGSGSVNSSECCPRSDNG